MTTVGKNVYSDALDNIAQKYNNTYYSSIKMKPKDIENDSSAEYNEESNEQSLKFKVGDDVRISKYKDIFAKGYTSNWSEEIELLLKKIKNTVPWTYKMNDLNGEEIVGSFMKKSCRRLIKKNLGLKR